MPPNVVVTVSGYTKAFVGILIERAREVQQQWATPDTPPPTPQKVPVDPTDFHIGNVHNDILSAESSSSSSALRDLMKAAQGVKEPVKQPVERTDLGPLLPDHFREALRRYKRDGEGGGAGLAGVSVGLGVPGTGAARLGGRRLFK